MSLNESVYLVLRIGTWHDCCEIMTESAVRKGIADGSLLKDPETLEELIPHEGFGDDPFKTYRLQKGLYIIKNPVLTPPRAVERVTEWQWEG